MTIIERGGTQDRSRLGRTSDANVGTAERWLSGVAGTGLVFYGLQRRDPVGVAIALAGAGLLCHGAANRSPIYSALGINTAATNSGPRASVKHRSGIHVQRTVMIDRSPEALYRQWRDLQTLPRFMEHLQSVQPLDGRRSHWVARAPAGMRAEWDAEIFRDVENELIAWRSLDGSGPANAGSVLFKKGPAGRGTELRVELEYDPPAGPLGAAIAAAFGEEPGQQVHEDLKRFKQLMEAGEIATTDGQPSGRR